MGRVAWQRRQAREERMRHTLAALKAGGALDMIERDGEAWIHIPPEYRRSTALAARYLLSCLPEDADRAAALEPTVLIAHEVLRALNGGD